MLNFHPNKFCNCIFCVWFDLMKAQNAENYFFKYSLYGQVENFFFYWFDMAWPIINNMGHCFLFVCFLDFFWFQWNPCHSKHICHLHLTTNVYQRIKEFWKFNRYLSYQIFRSRKKNSMLCYFELTGWRSLEDFKIKDS